MAGEVKHRLMTGPHHGILLWAKNNPGCSASEKSPDPCLVSSASRRIKACATKKKKKTSVHTPWEMNSITFNVSLIFHLLQMNCCNCAQYFSKDRRNVITAAFCQSAVVSSPWWTTFQQMLGIFFFHWCSRKRWNRCYLSTKSSPCGKSRVSCRRHRI